MRLLLAMMKHETNTFSPVLTAGGAPSGGSSGPLSPMGSVAR